MVIEAEARAALETVAPARVGYEPALDGVRAIAVSAVLVLHGIGVTSNHLGRGGFLGVDVFFVLSGYLITTLLLRERNSTGRIALGTFWARRARRLLPALVVTLGAIVVYTHIVSSGTRAIRAGIVPALFYYENWHMIGQPLLIEGHTWSLAIEEQWYLVWPIVLAIVLARGRKVSWRLFAAVAALTAASVVWTAHLASPLSSHAYFGTDTRGQSLLVGAGLAILLTLCRRPTGPRADRVIHLCGVLGLGVLFWAFATWRDASYTFQGGLVVVALASAAVILAATQPGDSMLRRLLSVRPLVALGMISYGVYLFDPVVIAIFNWRRTHLGRGPSFVLQIVITIVAAYASWRWIEQPIRRAPLRRAWPWALIALGVVAVLIGTATIDVPAHAAKPSASVGKALQAYFRPYAELAKSAPAGTTRLLVIGGNSGDALDRAADPYRGAHVFAVAVGTRECGLTSALSASPDPVHHRNPCTFAPGLLEGVARAFRPTTVVITIEQADVADRYVDKRTTSAGSAAWASDASKQLDDLRRRLPASVRQVWIVGGCGPTVPGTGASLTARADAVWSAYARAHAGEVRSVSAPASVCANHVPSRAMWPWVAALVARAPA